jgi:hypothetical protein
VFQKESQTLVTLSSSMFTSVNEATNVKVSSKCFIIIFIMVIYATLKFVKQVISHKETNYEMDMVINLCGYYQYGLFGVW